MAGDLSIGNLKATITLADEMSGPLDKVAKALGVSSKSLTALGGAAGLVVASIASATAAIVALGQRGAEVSDVTGAFEGLSARVGETADAMLGGMTKATLGTISNFDLMKMANTALGSGLVKSAADMETLAGGAKLLADRTGGDTAKAFDTLTDAIAKGKTATLKQFGVFVDSKVAIQEYTDKLGGAKRELTDQERATALSEGALKALRKELEEAGPSSADFADKIAKGKVAISNFTDSLAVAVANSPVVAAGMDAIREGIANAFGGTQQQTVQTLIGYVNKFAIFLVEAAQVGVTAARFITDAFNGTRIAFNAVLEGIASGVGTIAQYLADFAAKASTAPGILGEAYKPLTGIFQGIADTSKSLAIGFKEQGDKAYDSAVTSTVAFDALGAALETAEEKMRAADAAQVKIATSAPIAAKGVKDLGDAYVPTKEQVEAYAKSHDAAIAAQDAMTQNGINQMATLQDQIAVLQTTGLQARMIELQQAEEAEIAALYTKYDVESALYQQLADKIREKYDLMSGSAIDSANKQIASMVGVTLTGIQQGEQALAAAIAHNEALKENEEATDAQLLASKANVAAAEKKLNEEKARHAEETFNKIADAAKTFITAVFGKGKAASIATAIIDTAQAVVKALASAPPPLNYVLAGAVGAAGLVQINKIRSTEAGFALGTPGTTFVDFGRETSTTLHGPEAVVTPKQGASLAGMVEDALRLQDSKTVEELRSLRADMADERRRLPLFLKSVAELAKA